MKRNLPSIVTGLALVVILGLYMTTYQVRFTEVAVLKTFGEAQKDEVKLEPGLYPKWPWPIQEVRIYDKRTRVLRHHSLTNWVLVQRTLIHLSQMLEIIATGGEMQPTYGKEESVHARGALVDRAA